MAEALVVGAVLGAVFNVLLDRIASKEVLDFFKQRKLDDRVLGKLKMKMNTVSGLLEDAEEKQITKPAVRKWLDDLKDVAYDADDLLDEIAYKAREKQHLEAGPKKCATKITKQKGVERSKEKIGPRFHASTTYILTTSQSKASTEDTNIVNIRRIHIKGYRGIDFPKWVGDSSFTNIVYLRLVNCKYCTRLPPLGQLASLEVLGIVGFDSLVSVGAEFYGSFNSVQPFRSLKELYLVNMPKLQQWNSYDNETEEDDFTGFPLLKILHILDCPELEIFLPLTLERLLIEGCNKIISGRRHWDLYKLSFLTKFYLFSVEDIKSFPGMILLPYTLRSIQIGDLQNLKSLDYAGLHRIQEKCRQLRCYVIFGALLFAD